MKDQKSIDKYIELHAQVIQDLKDNKITIMIAENKIKSIFENYLKNATNTELHIDNIPVHYSIEEDIDMMQLYVDRLILNWNDVTSKCIDKTLEDLSFVQFGDANTICTNHYLRNNMKASYISFRSYGRLGVFTIHHTIKLRWSPDINHKTNIYIYGGDNNYIIGVLDSELDKGSILNIIQSNP